MNILLGVTGSVAAIKLPKLIFALRSVGDVKVVATDAALKIISKIDGFQLVGSSLKKEVCTYAARCRLDPFEELYTDKREWFWERIGDPVLHIDLKDWADILVIAPLTANTLAKMANGLCDNLLTCICRAWPAPKFLVKGRDEIGSLVTDCQGGKPVVIAPAMNTDMWEHPYTQRALDTLVGIYGERLTVVNPIEKKLACGTTGMGAMANVETIVGEVVGIVEELKDAKAR